MNDFPIITSVLKLCTQVASIFAQLGEIGSGRLVGRTGGRVGWGWGWEGSFQDWLDLLIRSPDSGSTICGLRTWFE